MWKTRKLLNLRHHSQFLSHFRCPAHLQFHPRCPRILLIHTLTSQRKLTKVTQKSAVDTQSDDPFQFDDPPVTAPLILPQRNSGYDHRDDLPHHIRTQLQQSRIRNLAQGLEPDAKRLRLDAGKRAVLMLPHDVSFGSECVLLNRRAASKEVTKFLSKDGKTTTCLMLSQRTWTKPGQVFVATCSICGTRDAGRAWYKHSKKVLEAAGFLESRLGCRAHACL